MRCRYSISGNHIQVTYHKIAHIMGMVMSWSASLVGTDCVNVLQLLALLVLSHKSEWWKHVLGIHHLEFLCHFDLVYFLAQIIPSQQWQIIVEVFHRIHILHKHVIWFSALLYRDLHHATITVYDMHSVCKGGFMLNWMQEYVQAVGTYTCYSCQKCRPTCLQQVSKHTQKRMSK